MNLNTLRLESFWGSDYFFDLADKYGIMIFNGLNCCSIWEEWDRWTKHTADVAAAKSSRSGYTIAQPSVYCQLGTRK